MFQYTRSTGTCKLFAWQRPTKFRIQIRHTKVKNKTKQKKNTLFGEIPFLKWWAYHRVPDSRRPWRWIRHDLAWFQKLRTGPKLIQSHFLSRVWVLGHNPFSFPLKHLWLCPGSCISGRRPPAWWRSCPWRAQGMWRCTWEPARDRQTDRQWHQGRHDRHAADYAINHTRLRLLHGLHITLISIPICG